jgi:hypothetical protein
VTENEDQKAMSTTKQLLAGRNPDQKHKSSWARIRFIARAYGGSLVITSFAFPIIASGATVCFFLAPQVAFTLLTKDSLWYAPVYGFLSACIICLIFAALRSRFSTASGANTHIYEELVNRHADLTARLNPADIDEKNHAAISSQNANSEQMTQYETKASRIAHNTYQELHNKLFHNHSGIEWTLETGYVNAWRLVHRTQEALVGFETLQEIIGEVVHDIRSIQKSAIPDGKDLIRKMLQAVKDLSPEALAYFDELRADRYYADLFPPHPGIDLADSTVMEPPGQTNPPKEIAREAIRQVKHAFNVYQDSFRHSLVRERNYTYVAIALTAFITYFLLCAVILWNAKQPAIGSAVAYYMIGAITGLFVRFYNETNTKNNNAPPDDYGQLISRLIATPLLSGLAAIGGVLVTATLPALSGQSVQKPPELSDIFNGTVSMAYLFAAALFGYAPNLIVGNLQQRARRYSTDLQNSKGEVSSKDD